jgi:uncharacterized protein YodC (DUF2158 family)
MAESKFKTGDIVKLKSGGPKMTVVNADEYNATLAWFDTNHLIHSKDFSNEIIELYLE